VLCGGTDVEEHEEGKEMLGGRPAQYLRLSSWGQGARARCTTALLDMANPG
jgi:hypothetical protein